MINTTSAPIAVTVANGTNSKITIVSVALSQVQFSYSGPALPITLNPGQSFSGNVIFSPTAAQIYTDTLIFTRANGSTIATALSGTGVQPPATISPISALIPTSMALSVAPCDSNFNCTTGTSSAVGQFVRITAHVAFSGTTNPTGQLCILDNSSPLNCGLTPVTDESWFTNSLPAGTNSLTATYPGDSTYAGSKSGIVKLTVGSTTSSASPTVAPSISTQPIGQAVTAGQTATFSVGASGTAPLTYQWKKNGTAISGATSASYITPPTTTSDNGAQFTVSTNNSAGTATSNAAVLTVSAASVAPSITSQPVSQSVTAGQAATFSVSASGTGPLSYQWSKNGTAISGATAASYTTPATTSSSNGAQFTVKVSNTAGSATSNAATLTIIATSTQLTVNPSSLNFGSIDTGNSSSLSATLTNSGNSNATISSVSVSGSGFNAPGLSGIVLSPGQSTSVNVTFAPSGSGAVSGSVVVTSNAANSPTTISLSGTGVQPPTVTSITVTPANQTVAVGAQVQFKATDNLGNDITASVIWTSSSSSIVSITSSGLATGVANGAATISATN